MSIKKTYIPAKPRSSKLVGTSMSGGVAGSVSSSSTGSTDPNSHSHLNKRVLDTITQEMLDNALREILGVESTEEITDENYFSALRTLKEILDNNEVLKGLFLSKTNNDTAQGFIEFLKGISVQELATLAQGLEIGNYTSGLLGSGASFKMNNGISELEVDKLTVRMIATFFEIVVSKLRHINGGLVLSRGSMKCIKVIEDADSYQCFFDRGENNEVSNTFVVNDQARCQVFNATGGKFYWRLVTAVGTDWIKLSKTNGIGDSIPSAGDDIVQLGYQGTNLEHADRIYAQIIDANGLKQYGAINDFTLEGKERTKISADGSGNKFYGDVTFRSGSGDKDLAGWTVETETAIQEAVEKIAPPVWLVQAVNILPNAPAAIFRRDKDEALHQLTLRAKFTRDGVDVTDIMNTSGLRLYEFERRNMWGEDDNGYLDSAWNLANKGRTQVTLTHEDIVFIGNINMRFNDELLETEYQRLK